MESKPAVCRTCKWWLPTTNYTDYGECKLIREDPSVDASRTFPLGTLRTAETIGRNVGESYLITHPTFGCVLHATT